MVNCELSLEQHAYKSVLHAHSFNILVCVPSQHKHLCLSYAFTPPGLTVFLYNLQMCHIGSRDGIGLKAEEIDVMKHHVAAKWTRGVRKWLGLGLAQKGLFCTGKEKLKQDWCHVRKVCPEDAGSLAKCPLCHTGFDIWGTTQRG